jgi:hypothetical protein
MRAILDCIAKQLKVDRRPPGTHGTTCPAWSKLCYARRRNPPPRNPRASANPRAKHHGTTLSTLERANQGTIALALLRVPETAHVAALIECRWAKVGTTLEVINTASGNNRLLGQYHRGVNAVTFTGERNAIVRPNKRNNVHAIKRRQTVDKETGEIRQSA